MAGHLRAGLLRHRDDGRRRRALRPRAVRHGGLPRLAAPGRPDDRGRSGQPEDGAGAAPDLRPDARAQVGHRRWASAPAAAGCSTTTPSSRASTTSCRSTSTSRAARRARRCSSTRSSSSTTRSAATKLGKNRENEVRELEAAALTATPTLEMRGLLRVTDQSGQRACREQPERGVHSYRSGTTSSRSSTSGTACCHGSGDTSGYRRPGAPRRPRRRHAPPLRRLVRRGGRQPRRAAPRLRGCGRQGRGRARRPDLPRAARAPGRLRARAARRPRAAVRDVLPASAASTTRTRPAASCTPSTPSCR